MYKVIMIVDEQEYVYGSYNDSHKANEVAMEVRESRQIETYVERAE